MMKLNHIIIALALLSTLTACVGAPVTYNEDTNARHQRILETMNRK